MTKSSLQDKLSDQDNFHNKKYQFYQKNQIVCAKTQGYPPWPATIDSCINDYGIYKVTFIGVKNYWANSKQEQLERLTPILAAKHLKEAKSMKSKKFSMQSYEQAFKTALEKLQKQKKAKEGIVKVKQISNKKGLQKTKKIIKNKNSTSRQVSEHIDSSRELERSFIEASDSQPIQMRRKIYRRQHTSQERSSLQKKSISNQKVKKPNAKASNLKKKYESQEEEEVEESPLMEFEDIQQQQLKVKNKETEKKIHPQIKVKQEEIQFQQNSEEQFSEKEEKKSFQQNYSKQEKKSLQSNYKQTKQKKIQNKQVETILQNIEKNKTNQQFNNSLSQVRFQKNKSSDISGNQIYYSQDEQGNQVKQKNSLQSLGDFNKKIDSDFLKPQDKYKPPSQSYIEYYQKHSKLTFTNKIQLSIKINSVQGGHQYQYKFNQLYQCSFIPKKSEQQTQTIKQREKPHFIQSQASYNYQDRMEEQNNQLHQQNSSSFPSSKAMIRQNQLQKTQKLTQTKKQTNKDNLIQIQVKEEEQKSEKGNQSNSYSSQSLGSSSHKNLSPKNQKSQKKSEISKTPIKQNEKVVQKTNKQSIEIPSPFKSSNTQIEQKSKKKTKSSNLHQINVFYREIIERRKNYPQTLKTFQNKLSKLQSDWDKTDKQLWKELIIQLKQYQAQKHKNDEFCLKKNNSECQIKMQQQKPNNKGLKYDDNRQIQKSIRDYHRYRLKKHTKEFQNYKGQWIYQKTLKEKKFFISSHNYQASINYIRNSLQLLTKYFLHISIEELDLAPFEQKKDNKVYKREHKQKSIYEEYASLAKNLHQSYLILYFRSIPIDILIETNVIGEMVTLIQAYNSCEIRNRIVQNVLLTFQKQSFHKFENQDFYEIFKKVDEHYICRVVRLFVQLLNSFKFEIKHIFKPIAIRFEYTLAKTSEQRKNILKNLSQEQKQALKQPKQFLDDFYINSKVKIVQSLRNISICMQKYKQIKHDFKRGIKSN